MGKPEMAVMLAPLVGPKAAGAQSKEAIMIYKRDAVYVDQYELSSDGKHGSRYREVRQKCVRLCRMTANPKTEPDGMITLLCLSDQLQIPIHWDFDQQQAYLEVCSTDVVRTI